MLNRRTRNLQLLSRTRRAARARLRYELLEPRHLLAAEIGLSQTTAAQQQNVATAPINWAETVAGVERIPLASLATVDRLLPTGVAGPIPLAAGEWIVQLRDTAVRSVRQIALADALLDDLNNDFTIISGLGARGALLVRGDGPSRADIESSLRGNPHVQFFQINQLIQGQTITPNDSDFTAGQLPGLTQINAPGAWAQSIGSMNIVVGVVDSGIDPTHQDLFLNIWLNQGEIPRAFLDDDAPKLVDTDGDGLITFYDLNNLKRTPAGIVVASTGVLATQEQLTTATPFASGENRHFVRDLNGNGRIDAADLLLDANWADGRDDDGNDYFDDLFGVNFRAGTGDPFTSNNPSDQLGHGTHVAGTIGAIGGNGTGVVGVNWQTSLMSLRILDNNNQGDSGAAIKAMNYVLKMREQYRTDNNGRVVAGANVRVLNNSWGQPGGREPSVEAAIEQLHEAGILFVAAAGNGNILGNGVDNDRTPFYPASYDVPNVIAVAASDANDRLATFSNFGRTSVDILAPGVGIRSTMPGGGYQSANGTSMAAPHVAGTAALIWSALPGATVDEVKQAILGATPYTAENKSVDIVAGGFNSVATGGRLNAFKSITADVFAPAARLIAKQDITTIGGTTTEFTIEYSHRDGIDPDSIGDDDLIVTRQWGAASPVAARLIQGSIVSSVDGSVVQARYTAPAPGTASFAGSTPVEGQYSSEIQTISNSTPVSIPDDQSSTIQSQIIVDDLTNIFGSIYLTIDIQHSYTEDLYATLITPSGNRIRLFSGVGGSGVDFRQTVFTNEASVPIAAGSAPFTGSFRPEESFSVLNDTDPNGTWTLEIEDAFPEDGGQLTSWSMHIPQRSERSTIANAIRAAAWVDGMHKLSPNLTISAEFVDMQLSGASGSLVAPTGERVRLFSNVSAPHVPSMSVVFNDEASTVIPDVILHSGTFRPEQALGSLEAKGLNGTWQLELDGEIGIGDAAEVQWSIEFTGLWDPLDYGQYSISTVPGAIRTTVGNRLIEQRTVGSFAVRIEDPRVLYADKQFDYLGSNTLRDAIITANTAGAHRTIILDSGTYTIDIPKDADHDIFLPTPVTLHPAGMLSSREQLWSNAMTGDFDITGSITIFGNQNDFTVIDAQGLDRVFKVHPGGNLWIERVTITGGVSPPGQGGGGILSWGKLTLRDAILRDNKAPDDLYGGGIALWGGELDMQQSWLDHNSSAYGGGVFVTQHATANIERSSFSNNIGGGVQSDLSRAITVSNSTFSGNIRGNGAIHHTAVPYRSGTTALSEDGQLLAFGGLLYDRSAGTFAEFASQIRGEPSISGDGRFVAFASSAPELVSRPLDWTVVFIYDRETASITPVSIAVDGTEANGRSRAPSISADGRYIAFESDASNLVAGDTNNSSDVFVYDRINRTIERISVAIDGTQANSASFLPSISEDGRFVAFTSNASNLAPGHSSRARDIFVHDRVTRLIERVTVDDHISGQPSISANGQFVAFESHEFGEQRRDVFVHDRISGTTQRISVNADGIEANASSEAPSISADGRFVAFHSNASNLVPGDTNGRTDVFVYDREFGSIERVNKANDGTEANGSSQAPSISADGRFVAFHSAATNLVTGDTNGRNDVFVYDRFSGETDSPLAGKSYRPLDAAQLTIVGTAQAKLAVSGAVQLSNSLLINATSELGPNVSAKSILQRPTPGLEKIGPLTRYGFSSPTHQLLRGNPAINAGSLDLAGTRDQSGNRRIVPDIGAIEAVDAEVGGIVYLDLNQNLRFDAGEPFVEAVDLRLINPQSVRRFVTDQAGTFSIKRVPPGQSVLDIALPKNFTLSVPAIQSVPPGRPSNGPASSGAYSADGRFVAFASDASDLVPGDTNGVTDVFVYDRISGTTQRISVNADGTETNASSQAPSISADGRFVAFHSAASNLVPGDTNGRTDVFVYDREYGSIERVNNANDGTEANGSSQAPSISADGRFVAFHSAATNLVSGDTNGRNDVFVYDRQYGSIQRVSVANDGTESNGSSANPSISADGRFIAFSSWASNLVPESTTSSNIFVYDIASGTIERVNVSTDGTVPNGGASNPSISADGRFVAFESWASNLVPGDTNDKTDIFVYDRENGSVELVSVATDGKQANDSSEIPSISADGRFVVFGSRASNLVSGDTNGGRDIFVYDRASAQIERVNVAADGTEDNAYSHTASISADGRLIAFLSFATNLVDHIPSGRTLYSIFNPLAGSARLLNLMPGDLITDLNFGLIPDPGSIRGRVFQDTIPNQTFDVGEPAFAGLVVFLDTNRNGSLDPGERSVTTDEDGVYQFLNVDSHQHVSVVARVPAGFEIVFSNESDGVAHRFFLPAGGDVTGRDFALRTIQTTGQSSRSEVHGRLFVDKNGSGSFDDGDEPLVGVEVFLDAANFGVRDDNEPRRLTDNQGRYSFDGLSARNAAVTTVLSNEFVHVNPLGSKFDRAAYPLNREVSAFGNPQAIASGDFNNDGFLDVAIALGEANKLSIRLNDGNGGFLRDEIDIDLGTNGARPTSLVVGQFDNDADQRLDVALTANSTGYVTVLLNFDPVSKQFASINHVKVGDEPLDIAAGDFTGNGRVDLVVVNKANNTVQVLSNNGSGVFTAGPGVPTGGRSASSIVVGNFTGDPSLDVAVIHASPRSGASNPFGEMTVLRGDGSGGLTRQPEFYTLGATPTDAVVADFNGDGRPDIAVSNFGTNSISILLGQPDGQSYGTFRVQNTTLGTASGVIDITVGDVDNDGDIDIFVSNLRDRNISIFRNDGPELLNPDPITREVRFQPLENIGLGQLSMAQRMPIIVDNFDNDTSGPGSKGTVDIVTILRATNGTTQLNVLKNTLVNGAHRVALTGLNVVNNRDFIIKPAILPPSFDAIANPLPILEDAGAQSITISNIVKGRTTGPALRFIVTSDNPTVIPSPGQLTFGGGTSTTFSYTPLLNANDSTNAIDPQQSRPTVLTVRAIDAGADGVFDTDGDGIFERSFTVSVRPVNDPPVFTVPTGVIVTQKAGTQAFANFITGFGPGGGRDEENQVLSAFTVATDNSFFITPPAIDANGQLTFTPSPNKSGTVPVTVSVSDNGGRANGGVDTTTKTFVINILPVNDPPTINLVGNQSVRADAGLRNVTYFATGFQPGGGEDEANQVISDFIVTVDSPGLFSVLPSISINGTLTYAPAIDRTGTATVSVQVRDSGGRANGGNDLSAVQTFTITVTPIPDTTRPTPVITPSVPALTNQALFPVDVDFGEPVDGFTLANITVSAGTKSALENLGGGKFRFMYTGSDGSVTFNIAENITNDLAGNPNFAAVPVTRTIDTVGVTAILDSPVANPTNATSFTATIEFGEPVVGFTLSDLTVLNGSATNLNPVNAATGSYSVTITPTADGTVTVLLPAGVVTDPAGNVNRAADPLIRTIDHTRPTVILTTNEPEQTNRSTFDIFAQFSEPVTELAKVGLSINGGTAGDSILVSPGLYRVPITAAVGAVQMQVVANAVNDLAGNPSQASSPLTIMVDPAVVFTPELTSTSAAALNTNTFNVSVNFGTQVSGFTSDKVVVVNGTAAGLPPVDVATGRYTLTVTADRDGQVSVVIPADVVNDLSGNANSASNALVRTIDTDAPQPKLSINVPSLTNQPNFVLTVEFGEEVTGFEIGDVVVSGASLSAWQPLTGGRYTMNVTATHGPVSFNLPAGVASDLAGNANLAATPITLTVDTTSPLPTLTTLTPQLSNAASFTVAANFGEPVIGFELTDLLLINGVASNLSELNQTADSFTFVVTPLSDGLVSVLIPAGTAADQAGNLTRGSNLLSRTFDRRAPVPILTTTEPSRTNKTTFEVIVNFGETVTELTRSDFHVTGATISDPVPLDLNNARYAVTLSGASGNVELQVKAAAVQDDAGNSSVASETLMMTVDTAALVPVVSSASASLLNSNTFDVTVLFGKEVIGFVADKVTVLGGTLSNFDEADRSTGRYTFRVQAEYDGVVTVVVSAGVVTDLAGNSNAVSNNLLRTIDRLAPTAVLSTNEPERTNKTTFEVFAEFTEPVTGLTAADLVVTGGNASGQRPAGLNRYAFTITATSGEVEIRLPAGAVVDAAGNTSMASNTLVRTIETTRVLPTLVSQVPPISNVSSFVVSIDFTTQVVGFVQSSLFAVGGTMSEFTVVDQPTGRYSVRVTPTVDGAVTLLLPANAATDSVGNGNLTAAPLVRTIDRVAPAITLSTSQSSPTLERLFAVIIQSSEAITGLTASSFQVSGGTIGQPVPLGDGRYSVAVTATGGMFELSVRGGSVTDAAGNVNAASNVLRIEVTPQTPPSTPTLAPTLEGQSIDLTAMADADLNAVEVIDLRGFGDNVLALDCDKIRRLFANSSVTVYADSGDTILFDGDWRFERIELVGGEVHRVFTNSGATIRTIGPSDFTNPQNRFDVDGSGEVTALDALHVLTSIRAQQIVDSQGGFLPLTAENKSSFQFVDVNQDNVLTPLDALLILIEMRRMLIAAEGPAGEQVIAPPLQQGNGLIASDEVGDDGAVEPLNTHNSQAKSSSNFTGDDFVQRTEAIQVADHDSDKSDEEGSDSPTVESFLLVDQAFADPELLGEKR